MKANVSRNDIVPVIISKAKWGAYFSEIFF